MGFSGGGSNVTKAHTHSSSIVQDGGALAFNNITQAGMAEGDITYSDGTALQILGLGSATDTLTVNAGATAPEWAAGGGGGGSMEFIERFTASASSTFTCTLATPVSDFVSIQCIFRGQYNPPPTTSAGGLELQIATDNTAPITNSGYSWAGNTLISDLDSQTDGGTDTDNFLIGPSTTSWGATGNITFDIQLNPLYTDFIACTWQQTGIRGSLQSWGSGGTYDSGAVGSIVGFYFTNSGGNNISANSTLDVYKLT
jgi:hypothetical protein